MRHACLMQRGMPVTRSTWQLGTSIIWNLTDETGITDTRLWSIVTRFFAQAATVVEESPPRHGGEAPECDAAPDAAHTQPRMLWMPTQS